MRFNINQPQDKHLIAQDNIELCLSKRNLACFRITPINSQVLPRPKVGGCGLGTCLSASSQVVPRTPSSENPRESEKEQSCRHFPRIILKALLSSISGGRGGANLQALMRARDGYCQFSGAETWGTFRSLGLGCKAAVKRLISPARFPGHKLQPAPGNALFKLCNSHQATRLSTRVQKKKGRKEN